MGSQVEVDCLVGGADAAEVAVRLVVRTCSSYDLLDRAAAWTNVHDRTPAAVLA